MSVEAPFSVSGEREKLEEAYSKMKETPGFSNLSNRQQRLLKESLYIQARAERGTDPASKSRISEKNFDGLTKTKITSGHALNLRLDDDETDPQDFKGGYELSQDTVSNWNCHAAVYAIETETAPATEHPDIPLHYFEVESQHFNSVAELESAIKEKGRYPQVLHIKPERDHPFNLHTCLVLGPDSSGDMVVWEKEGYHYSYRVTTLETSVEEAFEEFHQKGIENNFCGIRDLRGKEEYKQGQ